VTNSGSKCRRSSVRPRAFRKAICSSAETPRANRTTSSPGTVGPCSSTSEPVTDHVGTAGASEHAAAKTRQTADAARHRITTGQPNRRVRPFCKPPAPLPDTAPRIIHHRTGTDYAVSTLYHPPRIRPQPPCYLLYELCPRPYTLSWRLHRHLLRRCVISASNEFSSPGETLCAAPPTSPGFQHSSPVAGLLTNRLPAILPVAP
jgi:hypothetical protein